MFSYNNDLEFDIKTPVYNTCKPNYLKLVSSQGKKLIKAQNVVKKTHQPFFVYGNKFYKQ